MTTDGNVLRRSMVLAPQAAAVRQARNLVKEACVEAGTDQITCDAAVLLTSETVTNAFVHGRSEARLEVAAHPGSVYVEVGDDNSRHPTSQPRDEDALDGRGLEIVRLLAARWGVRDEAFGKIVWFEVRADHRGA
jgi:anti-sigma regulatory factor (Ser/Thr protein kinase)